MEKNKIPKGFGGLVDPFEALSNLGSNGEFSINSSKNKARLIVSNIQQRLRSEEEYKKAVEKQKADQKKFWEEKAKRRRQMEAEIEKNYKQREKEKAERKKKHLDAFLNEYFSNVAGSDLEGIQLGAYLLRNQIGSGLGAATEAHASELSGKMDMSNAKIYLAEAHKKMNDYLTQIDLLKEAQQGLIFDRTEGGQPAMTERNAELSKQWLDYQTTIDAISLQMEDPILKLLDSAYKTQYIEDQHNFLLRTGDYLSSGLHWLTHGNTNYYNDRLENKYNLTHRPSLDINADIEKNYNETEDVIKNEVNKLKGLRKQYDRTMKWNQYFNEHFLVSDNYKNLELDYNEDGRLSLGYFIYSMPGMIGSSNSSWNQIYANLIQTTGMAVGAALAPATGGASVVAAPNVATAISAPFQFAGGTDENYANIGDRRTDNIKYLLKDELSSSKNAYNDAIEDLRKQSIAYWKSQGRSDEWIKERYASGTEQDENNILRDLTLGITKSNDPRVINAMIYSTAGLKAEFLADNVRTMSEFPVQITTQLYKGLGMKAIKDAAVVNIKKGASKVGFDHLKKKIIKDSEGNVKAHVAGNVAEEAAVRSGLRNAAKRGYNAGESLGDALGFGYTGSIVGGAAGATFNSAAYAAKSILPELAQAAIEAAAKQLSKKYGAIAEIVKSHDLLYLPLKYGIKTASNVVASGLSEGAEEAVQYLNSKEDFASKYGWQGTNLNNLIANDIIQGGRVANALLAKVGLTDSELLDDQEFWSNYLGGLGLGGAHPAIMTVPGAIKDTYQQYRTNEAIATSAIFNREANKINRANYAEIARLASLGRGAAVIETIKDMVKTDSRNADSEFTPEGRQQLIDAATEIVQLTNDRATRNHLESMGIKYGSDKYATAIADIYDLRLQYRANTLQGNETNDGLKSIYESKLFLNELDRQVDNLFYTNLESARYLSEQRIKAGEEAVAAEIKRAKEAGIDVETEEFKNNLSKIRESAKNAKTEELKAAYRENVLNITRAANKVRAILQLKAENNTIEDFFNTISSKFGISPKRPDAKTISDNIDKLLQNAKQTLKRFYQELDVDATDADLLSQLDSISEVIGIDSEEAVRLETNAAIISADRQILNQRLNDFQNPIKDGYSRRIDAIIDTNDRNAKVDWMVNDIFNGDAVVKLELVLRDERNEEIQRQIKEQIEKRKTQNNVEKDPFDSGDASSTDTQESKWSKTREQRKEKLSENKKRYLRQKQLARNAYLRRKNKYRNWKRGNTNAFLLPGLVDAIVATGNKLMQYAQTGSYKINEFVSDIKEIYDDVDVNDIINDLKKLYRKHLIKAQAKNPDIVSNFSSEDEIESFAVVSSTKKNYIRPEISTDDTGRKMQELFYAMEQDIIPELSTYSDVFVKNGDDVEIYTNDLYDVSGPVLDNIENSLKQHNTSDQEFKQAIIDATSGILDFPVDTYVLYRNVNGIEKAISRRIAQTKNKNSDILLNAASTIRDAVVDILLGKDDVPVIGFDSKQDSNFIEYIKSLKEKFDHAEYTIIATRLNIYGNVFGKNVCAQADVILINKNGEVILLDVLLSYTDLLHGQFDQKPYGSSKYTRRQISQRQFDYIESIINSRFDSPVIQEVVLPIVWSDRRHEFYPEGFILMNPKNTNTDHTNSQEVEKYKQNSKTLVDSINERIDLCNSLIDELYKHGVLSEKIDKLLLQEYDNEQLYLDYIASLTGLYSDINNRIQQLSLQILDARTEELYDVIPEPEDFPQSYNETLFHEAMLTEKINSLDVLLDDIDNVLVTTPQEKDRIDLLMDAIFEAQTALDNVIKYEDASVNIEAAATVITNAMEKLAQNSANFGEGVWNIQKWWLNNFSQMGLSESAEYAAYAARLQEWCKIFLQRGFDDKLDQNPALLRWYSSLLNIYFSKLLDNLESHINKFSEKFPPLLKDTALAWIQYGRNLIQSFNYQWGVEPDTSYGQPAENELERANKMSVKWMDLYGESTSHTFSINEMRDKSHYWMFSQFPDFLEKSDVIISLNNNGEPVAFVKYFGNYKFVKNEDGTYEAVKTDTPNEMSQWLSFDTDVTQFPPEDAARIKIIKRGNKKLISKLKAILTMLKEPLYADYKLKFTKSLNKGTIKYPKDTRVVFNVQLFLFKGPGNNTSLYSIKLGPENKIGIVRVVVNKSTGNRRFDVVGGPNLTIPLADRFDSQYLKGNTQISSGLIVYFYDYGDGNRIGVPIISSAIGDKDAIRLVDLMTLYARGMDRTSDGYDILSLLNQRLYLDSGDRFTGAFNNVCNQIHISKGIRTVTIGNVPYDLIADRQKLIDRISILPNVINGRQLNDNMNNTSDQVMSSVRQEFANTNAETITLPNGLIISRDDMTHQEPGYIGSTWLGYFLRNGIFCTRAYGKGYRQLNIDNVQAVKENQADANRQNRNDARSIANNRASLLQRASSGLAMKVAPEELVQRNEQEIQSFRSMAILFFEKVFGETKDLDLNSVPGEYIELESGEPCVVGLTASNLIKLSMYAPESAIYHEAFHKLMELVLPDDKREMFYQLYRDKYGKNLTERQVAEGLTDIFTTWFENKLAVTKAKSFKKIIPFYKKIKFLMGLAYKLGVPGYIKLMTLNKGFVKGKYANRSISDEKRLKFYDLFGEGLYYKVENRKTKKTAQFKYITNSSDLSEICNSLIYYILESYNAEGAGFKPEDIDKIDDTTLNRIDKSIIDDLCGYGIPDDELEPDMLAFREIFQTATRKKKVSMKVPTQEVVGTKNGKPIIVMKDKTKVVEVEEVYYPNFAAIQDKVTAKMAAVMLVEEGRLKLSEEEYDEDEAVQRSNIDKYDKASQEFNKLDSVNKRVKLFFATVPYLNPDGSLDCTKNAFFTPSYMPLEEVYNIIANDLYDVMSIAQLKAALEKKALSNPMYRYISDKFNLLYDNMYNRDDSGNIVSVNYDTEAFVIQIFSAIKSQKMDFFIARSTRSNVGKEIDIIESSTERDSKMLSTQWSSLLQDGQVAILDRFKDAQGNYKFRLGVNPNVFKETERFLKELTEGLRAPGSEFTIDGYTYNKHTQKGLLEIKQDIIYELNKIGIMINDRILDYMLINNKKYNSLEAEGLYKWLTDSDVKCSIESFYTLLESFTYGDKPNTVAIDQGYKKNGFVNELANWVGKYNRVTTQQGAYALQGKKLYSITQNDSLSKIVTDINTNNTANSTVNVLTLSSYNLRNVKGILQGSIVLKALLQGGIKLSQKVYIGFKSDNRGDTGVDYKNSSIVDDYMAKLTMLQKGYMILPTLADKGTWKFIDGVDVPGMRFITTKQGDVVVDNVPKIRFVNGEPYLVPSDVVLNLMIEYAECEKLSIQECMEDLGYKNIPDYQMQGRKVLDDSEKIINYHTPHIGKDKNGNKYTVEPNGTRFWSLTQIVVLENGKEVTYNLNDPNQKSVDLLKLANEKFFSKSIEEKRDIIARTLAIQNRKEVLKAIELGIVDVKNNTITDPSTGTETTTKDNSLMSLDSSQLNKKLIDALTEMLIKQIPQWIQYKGNNQPVGNSKKIGVLLYAERYNLCRSLAIAAILGDATNRSIICSQESLRLFIGNPAQFKVRYNKEAGIIDDSTFDIQKRIGGLVSTGEDNVVDIYGVDDEYTCAEVKDYEIASLSDVADKIDDLFILSAVREAYAIYLEDVGDDDAWTKPYTMTVSEIEEAVKNSSASSIIEKAKENAQKFGDAYKGGINVADGASYITDTMCENMLRMRGAYSDDVKKAFDILRSKNEKYSWVKRADAYKLIYDAVNIVTTKYTAYGFRPHTLANGDIVPGTAVAYYNKFALFPLFPCIATGKMNAIYNKMLDEKVDMVLMTSAVKLGSQGAIEFNGEELEGKFNVYKQKYQFLRRQQNTDPEEGDLATVGTQMVKIGLLNLRLNRIYKRLNGESVSGQDLLDEFMNSIKQLSKFGEYKLNQKFMTNGAIDPEKLSRYLNELLSSRNANENTLDAIQVVTDKDGNKRLKCPISATSDATWIESILISTVNKAIIDIVVPGDSFVQRSVFAMEGSSTKGGSILSDENMSPEINGGKRLQMINEKGSMDAVISIDYFYKMFPHLKTMSFEKARQWLIDNNIIGPNADTNTIGYRIPTQAQSSIHGLRFVDVISAVKSTIILPAEFTKITGSDFDIDHLYLCSYHYHTIDDSGAPVVTRHFDPTEEDLLEKYHQNKIMEVLLTLLGDVENSMNSLYKSIDNDTELLTNISDLIPSADSDKHLPFNFGTLSEQIFRRTDYMTGKTGIGPFALNVTNLVLTYLYGVKFKNTTFTKSVGLDGLDHIVDTNGNYINSWLSGFINSHVDIIKDPYISKLNTNPFTYNMINLLIRAGWGEAAVWFVCQPIIRDMATAENVASSQYARDTNKDKTVFAAKEAAKKKAILKYMDEHSASEETLMKYIHGTDKDSILEKIRVVRKIRDNVELYKEIATHPNAETVTVNGVTYNVKDEQRDVFYAWKSLEKYMLALSKLVQLTKIDTRKHGKNFMEIHAYLANYDAFFHPLIDDSVFDMSTLKKLINDSWIEQKTRSAIEYPTKILGNQTFNANSQFVETIVKWATLLAKGNDGFVSNKMLNSLSRALQTAIKSLYIIQYAKEYLGYNDSYIAGLFVENKDPKHPGTMNNRLNRLLDAVRNNPKYSRLKTNMLLNQITTVLQESDYTILGRIFEKPKFITVSSTVTNSKVNEIAFREAWLDLLNDEDKFVRGFARDLIIYSFLTSGEYNGWNKLFKYVPIQWISGEVDIDYHQSFADFVLSALDSNCQGYLSDKMLDDIISNNFNDYTLVKKLNKVDSDTREINYVLSEDKNVLIGAKVSARDKKNIREYVAITKSDYRVFNNAFSNDVYKLVGSIEHVEGGKKYYIPVYVRIPKRGYHNNKKYDIYEYGWNFRYAENYTGLDDTKPYSDISKKLELIAKSFDFTKLTDDTAANAISKIIQANDDTQIVQSSSAVNTVRGDNIAAGKRGTSDLARKLTNKYNNITVEYKGTLFDNAEHAYQTWKSGQFDQAGFDAHGERGQAKADRNTSFQTMVEIITAKLQQHPELVLEINSRGGLAYLQASTHNVIGDAFWESSGQNGFIRALIQAYNNVTTTNNTTPEHKWVGSTKYYTRQDVANDPTTLYIFTDNTDRTSGGQSYGEGWYKEKYGEGGYGSDRNPTSAIIRGLDNAVPISTMRWFYKNHPGVTHPRTDRNSAARWHDSNFDEFKQVFDDEIQQIKDLWDTGRFRRIVSPVGDMGKSPFFGSKLTEITKERTPRIYEYMLEKFKELQDYIENPTEIGVEQTTQEQPVSMFDNETMQRIYQAWEYMEDSANTYPKSDIKNERHVVTSMHGISVERDMGIKMYNFVENANSIIERNSGKMISVPYSEYKDIVSRIDRFDDIRGALLEENYYKEKEVYGKYNKNSKTLTISEDVYDLYKLISENQDVILNMADIMNETENRHEIITGENVLLDVLDYGFDLFDSVKREVELYSELDLFQDTTYSDMTQNEQQEAEELMKRCKGGE